MQPPYIFNFFFFNDTATTEIYTLSLHDALPIWFSSCHRSLTTSATGPSVTVIPVLQAPCRNGELAVGSAVRKSTRLNSSHDQISYAVFCLKKKKKKTKNADIYYTI